MADLITNYNAVRWDERGPYWVTQSGQKSYIPPATAAQMADPRLQQWAASRGEVLSRDANGVATGVVSNAAPTGGYVKSRGVWNPNTGQFDQGLNPGGLLGTLEGAAAFAGPAFIGPAIAGAAAPAASSGLAADGTIPFSTAPGVSAAAHSGAVVPGAGLASATGPLSTAAGAGSAAGTGAAGGAASRGIVSSLTDAAKDPRTYLGLASLLPAMFSGGGSGSPFDNDQIQSELAKTLALQRSRMEQAQPAYDALVNMAYGMSPTRYRGAQAPSGYTPHPAQPEGPYQAVLPKFGGK